MQMEGCDVKLEESGLDLLHGKYLGRHAPFEARCFEDCTFTRNVPFK